MTDINILQKNQYAAVDQGVDILSKTVFYIMWKI